MNGSEPLKDGLSNRELLFSSEYLVDLNAKQAAIRAGYSPKTAEQQASRLLRKVKVKDYINSLMEKRAEETGITSKYVLETIVDTVERCRQVRQVVDRKGEPIFVETPKGDIAPAYTFDSGGVLKGCELLGKHLKLFTDKVEQTGKDGAPIQHDHNVTVKLSAEEAYLKAIGKK